MVTMVLGGSFLSMARLRFTICSRSFFSSILAALVQDCLWGQIVGSTGTAEGEPGRTVGVNADRWGDAPQDRARCSPSL